MLIIVVLLLFFFIGRMKYVRQMSMGIANLSRQIALC